MNCGYSDLGKEKWYLGLTVKAKFVVVLDWVLTVLVFLAFMFWAVVFWVLHVKWENLMDEGREVESIEKRAYCKV